MTKRRYTTVAGSVESFGLGLDAESDPRQADASAAVVMLNAYPAKDGHAVKRPGGLDFFDELGGPVRFIERLETEDGSYSNWIVCAGDAVMAISDDPVSSLVYEGLDVTKPMAHCVWQNRVYFSDGATGLRSFGLSETTRASSLYLLMSGRAAYSLNGFAWGEFGVTVTIKGTAVTLGAAGDGISLAVVQPDVDGAFGISVTGSAITVTLERTSDVIVCDPVAMVAALNADASASALATFTAEVSSPAGYDLDTGYWSIFAHTDSYPITVDDALATTSGGSTEGAIETIYESGRSFSFLAARAASERLFGIDAADEGNVRWCDAYDASSWGALSVYSPGGRFIALQETGDTMLLYQRDQIFRIDGSDPATWIVRPIASDGLGCAEGAHKTLRDLEGINVYLSPRGLAYFDGSRPRIVSAAVAPLVPDDALLYDGAFTVMLDDLLALFYASGEDVVGCDRCLVYDYRRDAWGGPWTFEQGFISGASVLSLSGVPGLPVLGTASGQLMRLHPGLFSDNGSVYEYRVRTKSWDGGRYTLDKIVIGLRLSYKTSTGAGPTVSVLCEDEAVPRASATFTPALPAGEDIVEKRLQNLRARSWCAEVSDISENDLELVGGETDFFYSPRPY